jgi:hypothetical protein
MAAIAEPAADELSSRLLDEGAADGAGKAPATAVSAPLTGPSARHNPFASDPHPALAWSVRRFGFMGLLFGALTAATLRLLRRAR